MSAGGRAGRWWITAEAAAALTLARGFVALVPYRHWHRLLGLAPADAGDDGRPSTNPLHLSIRRALDGAGRRLPWHSNCLARAIAGQMMLRRRGTHGTLVIGVSRQGDAMAAHAWLLADKAVVCGGTDAAAYVPIAAFAARRNRD